MIPALFSKDETFTQNVWYSCNSCRSWSSVIIMHRLDLTLVSKALKTIRTRYWPYLDLHEPLFRSSDNFRGFKGQITEKKNQHCGAKGFFEDLSQWVNKPDLSCITIPFSIQMFFISCSEKTVAILSSDFG